MEGGNKKLDVSVGIMVAKPKSAKQDEPSCLIRMFGYRKTFRQLPHSTRKSNYTHSFQVSVDQIAAV